MTRFHASQAEIIAAPEEEETGMDHLLDEGQKQHDDLMQKWKQHGDQKLRKVADQPEGDYFFFFFVPKGR